MDSEYKKIGRVLSLYDRLSSGKIIYLKDEINATGVSDRSFKRDITELRNYLAEKAADGESRKEIIYDRNRNCYYMTEEKEALPDYQEIFAIAKILLGSKGLSRVEMNQVVEYLLSLYERTNEVNGPLPLLLESSCVVMDRVHEEIMFCEKFELPPRKMIILSASVNEKLYEDVSGGGERVRFRNIPEVKYDLCVYFERA